MSKVEIKQHDYTDCGAACLASISAHYGLFMSIARIRQDATTDSKGTNLLGLIQAAKKLGFVCKGVKSLTQNGNVNLKPLSDIPLPAIAHIQIKNQLLHYVVIYKIDKKWIQVMDPASGKLEKWTLCEFEEQWTGILLILVPHETEFRKGNEKSSIFERFMYLISPHRTVVVQAIFGALVYTILGLATSIYVQKIVDHVLPNANENLLNLLGVIMIVILVVGVLVNYLKSLFILKVGQLIDARLLLGYYKHMMKLPQSFFDSMRTGELISRMDDAIKIRLFISNTLISLVVNVFTILCAFALMFTYYWKLALIIIFSFPMYVVVFSIYNKLNKITQRKIMEDSADFEAHIVESINVARTIKSFGIEQFANIKTETRFISLLQSIFKSEVNALGANSASGSISQLFTIILLWYGSYFVIDNEITPGELLSFYALIAYFIGSVGGVIGMNLAFQDAKIAAERLFEVMDLEKEDNNNQVNFNHKNLGDITFENITFSYNTRSVILQELNLQIRKGTITAIVGESGSGKSTLASLLQKLYPIQEGSIRIGEFDIKHIDTTCLRNIIGVVPQKIDLFDGSLIDNIALGENGSDIQMVYEVCRSVGLLDFIESLPDGFSTRIGENGVSLSGGQRQRLAIARALYRNPYILILDEATSALDSQSESYIKEIMLKLRDEGRTIIVIAHRLGTITIADKVAVLEQGRVVEEGMHSELMLNKGLYAKLMAAQLTV